MYVIKSNRQTNSYTVRKINRITQVVRVGKRGLQGETGPQGPKGDQGDPATNLVQSVNGKQGVVVLDATDVGADPTGSASQALQDAKDYTDSEVSTLDSSLATVAKTGSYNDLSNKPTIPSIAGLATETYVNNAVAPKANTSDLGTAAFEDVEDLPVSTAQQTALNAKANASDTVNLTGNQTVAGVKTFSSSPVVPTATTGTQAVNKAQMDAADALKFNKAGDTMTGPLVISSNTMVPINISGTGGSNFLNITMTNNNANTGTQNVNERRLIKNSAGTLRPALEQFSYLTTPTAGAERSTVRYFTFSNGAQTKVMEFDGPDVLVENQLSVGGARYISGTGFPNGVVSAPVGSTYIDTAATNGAISWVKATGSGTTGWVVSVGDTGWRSVSGLVDNVDITRAVARIRRCNNEVQVQFDFDYTLPGTTGTEKQPFSDSVYSTDLYGFRPPSVNVWERMAIVNATGTALVGYFKPNDKLKAATTSPPQNRMRAGYLTNDPWPTTLPGTAV